MAAWNKGVQAGNENVIPFAMLIGRYDTGRVCRLSLAPGSGLLLRVTG